MKNLKIHYYPLKGSRAVQIEKNKYQILSILRENLKNPHPQVVDSEKIADKLHIHVSETRNLLKVLNQNGAVVTDLDGQYSLITPEGLAWLRDTND